MLTDIINTIVDKLEESGVQNVYSAFDAYPIEKKGEGIFTIVGIGAFETACPIYSLYNVYFPFRTEAEINVTADKNTSMAELYSYYDANIQPAVFGIADMKCTLKKMTVKFDSNIQRLVLTVRILLSGMTTVERSN